jgi:VWFA-related protein
MNGPRIQSNPLRTSLTALIAGALVLGAVARRASAQAASQAPPEPAGQATQEKPAPGEKFPTLTSNVDEVSLDLVIHNKSYEPVLNLKPEDLVVLDDGKRVKLTGLHLVSADSPNAPPHMVTLVFDSFRGPIAKSAHTMADRVLAARPTQGFSFAVMDFTNRLRLVQGFTSDRATVENAVQVETDSNAIEMATTLSQSIDVAIDKKADAARNTAVAKAEKDLIAIAQTGADTSGRHVDFTERARAQALLRALQDTPEIAQKQKAWLNLAGLMALARAQQRMTDRRAIIYFTINRMMDPASERMLKTIADVATEAGVSLYTVDLDATPHNRPSDGPNARFNGVGQTGTPAQESSLPIQGEAPPPPAAPIGPARRVRSLRPEPRPSGPGGRTWQS